MKWSLILAVVMATVCAGCAGTRDRSEAERECLRLPPRLYPGLIVTTPEGAYILDLLWLKAGPVLDEG